MFTMVHPFCFCLFVLQFVPKLSLLLLHLYTCIKGCYAVDFGPVWYKYINKYKYERIIRFYLYSRGSRLSQSKFSNKTHQKKLSRTLETKAIRTNRHGTNQIQRITKVKRLKPSPETRGELFKLLLIRGSPNSSTFDRLSDAQKVLLKTKRVLWPRVKVVDVIDKRPNSAVVGETAKGGRGKCSLDLLQHSVKLQLRGINILLSARCR